MAGDRVLVTGGSGFIGTHLVRALRERGDRVVVADLVPMREPHEDVEYVAGDLLDERVRAAACGDGVAAVYHLAARTSVLQSIQDPAGVTENNAVLTGRLLESARAAGATRFVMASTNAVVGDVGEDVITTAIAPRPLTPYGSTKAAAEMLMSAYTACYDMRCCALRLTNVYGPAMTMKDSIVARIMRAALTGTGMPVYGDGTQRRDYVHVHDVAKAFVTAAADGLAGPNIVGLGASYSVLAVLELAREVTGAPLPAEHTPAKKGEMPAVVVDVTDSTRLGVAGTIGLRDGLVSVWADFQERSARGESLGP
jgi:UDP-glucose 4-epimerase